MNITFESDRPVEAECEVHFNDKTFYRFDIKVDQLYSVYGAPLEAKHTVPGRWLPDVNKVLVRYLDYWYEEYVPRGGDPHAGLKIKLTGRDRATQMLRDAAMRAKPVVE
jgi:hypothetical protein